MGLILPEHYDPRLSVRETQEAIKYIRDTFQKEFGKEMNLERISAPLFVEKSSGLNDDLNGVKDRYSSISQAFRERQSKLYIPLQNGNVWHYTNTDSSRVKDFIQI